MKKLPFRTIAKIVDLSNRGLNYREITKITGASYSAIKKYTKVKKLLPKKDEYTELLTYLNQIEVFKL